MASGLCAARIADLCVASTAANPPTPPFLLLDLGDSGSRSASEPFFDRLLAVAAPAAVGDITEAMTEIDVVMGLIQSSRAAGLAVPREHPDLVPANEAKRLAALLLDCGRLSSSADKGPEYAKLMTASRDAANELAASFVAKLDKDALEKRYGVLGASRQTCHVGFRAKK